MRHNNAHPDPPFPGMFALRRLFAGPDATVYTGHYGRQRAECIRPGTEALCGAGFPRWIPLRLRKEVRSNPSAGTGKRGRKRAGWHDSVVSLADLSESLHAGDGALSRTP